MKVLYLEDAYGFGGSLTGLLHLINALPQEITPMLVTTYDPRRYTDMAPGLMHREVNVQRPPQSRHWLPGIARYCGQFAWPWYKALRRLTKEFQPDLIHCNNGGNVAASWIGRQRRVPVVAHDKGFAYPGRPERLIYRRHFFSHHIATSGPVAKHMESLGLDPQHCTTIYEPVVGPPEDQIAKAGQNEVPVIAMHSMLTPWKGQHIFLQAIGELRRRRPGPFRVVIAGTSPGGEPQYVARLHRLTQELELGDLVQFPGHIRHVYGFLKTVDIAVHAAVKPEPFGRVAAEAMLCGLPNVVTLDGGPAAYVQHRGDRPARAAQQRPCHGRRDRATACVG